MEKEYEKEIKGAVITNYYFTYEARELAKEQDIELIDKEGLISKTYPNLFPKLYYM